MRAALFSLLLLPLAGCGGGESGAPAASALLPAPEDGFQIASPEIVIPPGTEATYCYYFTLPLREAAGVRRWESAMSPGSHHLTVYFTVDQAEWDGALVPHCNAYATLSRIPVWAYSAQTPRQEFVLPDGIGMTVPAEQHGFVQMHYVNATDQPITARVAVNAHTYARGEAYVPAAAFVTYATHIDLPAGVGQEASASGSCAVPDGARFLAVTTHAHRRSIATWVQDGPAPLFASDDWQHPEVLRFAAPSYFTFASGTLVYGCAYRNDLDQPVHAGSSAETDEMCMAVGYFFPATRSILCINDVELSL